MKTIKRHAAVVAGSLLAATMLTGVALAGNPHGTAPGQAKAKGSVKASTKATTHGSGRATVHASGRAKTHTSVTTSSTVSAGVKSSSTTGFDTNAAAGSSQTKLYGNGKTAGEIAMQNGASASTNLYGPGNSQPHKAVLCSTGKVHLVDVHALKSHSGSSCTSASTSALRSSLTFLPPGILMHLGLHVAGALGVGHARTRASVHARTRASVHSGVLGAQHTQSTPKSVSGQAKPAHAVLGTATFTG
jgi:hypothetical protein